jgi:hypothetical protein
VPAPAGGDDAALAGAGADGCVGVRAAAAGDEPGTKRCAPPVGGAPETCGAAATAVVAAGFTGWTMVGAAGLTEGAAGGGAGARGAGSLFAAARAASTGGGVAPGPALSRSVG